ncbi:MAG: hypothetical protein K1W04_02510 [Oscillospiraceae bacterium]|jgi:chromosome segregation ATPase
MSATEHRFRTAAFGFNRQDVMQYIEAVHKDYAARIKSVKGELEQERDQRSSLEEQGSLASSEAQAAEKAAQRSKEELEEVRRALLEAQRERDSLQLQLQAAQQDLAVLQEAADRMAPAARAYETLKDKAAGIELDAHKRAQVIVKAGEEEAAQTRRKVAQWLRQAQSSYARLCGDVSATLSHATTEMERAAKSLDAVYAELDEHGRRLEDIAVAAESQVGGKSAPEGARAVEYAIDRPTERRRPFGWDGRRSEK